MYMKGTEIYETIFRLGRDPHHRRGLPRPHRPDLHRWPGECHPGAPVLRHRHPGDALRLRADLKVRPKQKQKG